MSTSGARRATLATIAASAGRVGGHRVQGAQRPRRRRPDHPGAGGGPAREARLRRPPQPRPRGAQPVVELVFDDELNAYATEIVQGIAGRGGRGGRRRGRRRAGPSRRGGAARSRWARELVATGREAVIGVVNSLTARARHRAGPRRAAARGHRPDRPAARPASPASARPTSRAVWPRPGTCSRSGTAASPTSAARPTAACNQARMHGFRAAMEAAGLPVPDGYVRDGLFRYQDGVDGGDRAVRAARAAHRRVRRLRRGRGRAWSRRPGRTGCGCRRTSASSGSTTPSSRATARRR